ncbi:HNH endonuclease [Nocardia otitidiscaviarum]|uniref:HNH endonuclease n=1 Tax=Nocardia otitidiscaviarum TaxID=1823 RepID=UPI001893FCF4|nr:HNH endonuclease signature motif containing protein [Nocardia otitidiscaviarum]MBF6133498.1 HNH endonuclease [Nocardia otitidiscaviarum]
MAKRSTTTRDRHRAIIARGKPPCGICGHEIDYTLQHLDPGEFVVDHVTPLNKGGTDTLDNKQAAHRACNRAKSDHLPDELAATVRVFVTDRTW